VIVRPNVRVLCAVADSFSEFWQGRDYPESGKPWMPLIDQHDGEVTVEASQRGNIHAGRAVFVGASQDVLEAVLGAVGLLRQGNSSLPVISGVNGADAVHLPQEPGTGQGRPRPRRSRIASGTRQE